jgi:D-mannonate dehydratase
MEITIIINEYEIANLVQALKMVPRNGEWYSSIINKVQTAIEASGLSHEQVDWNYNSGMDIKSVRRHLDILEHRGKYGN